MKVTIAIPIVLFSRYSSLKKEIESINTNTYKNIHIVIVVDGNAELFEAVKLRNYAFQWKDISVILNEKRMDWIASINRVFREFDSDYYIYAADDLIFPAGCIESAITIMQRYFADGFGVISLAKVNKATFGLIGNKFVEHFPNREVLCPDYLHFGSDREITEMANKLEVYDFIADKKQRAKHTIREDKTWELVNETRHKDPEMRRKRREKGYKWGIDFNLIGRKCI